jgi:hypothetical protein
MAPGTHYFIERTNTGEYAIRAKGSDRASGLSPTQEEAIMRAKKMNPTDHPEVERVRNTRSGDRGKWRRA